MYEPNDIKRDQEFEDREQTHYNELMGKMETSADDAGHILFTWDSDFSNRLVHTIAKNLQTSDLILATAIRSLFSEEVYKWANHLAERDLS